MANYRYKIYNKRGKLVAEATTKREAEKEAKKLGGHYMNQSGLYQLKNPHCVSNPSVPKRFTTDEGFTIELTGNNTWLDGSKASEGWVSGWVREWQGHQPDPTPYVLVQFGEDTSHVPTSVSVTIANGDPDKRDYEPVDAGYIVNEYLAANPVDRPYNHGDEYEVGDTVYDRDTGEPWEVERVFNKSATTFVALGSNDGRYSMPQVRYQDVPNMFSATPVAPQSNPHCYKNPADDPDFQRGFSAGLAAVAAATSYYGKRANPEPSAPSQASSAYQAGFVAAVQMFGIHLISQSDISRAVISELAGATLVAPPTMPRPTPPKRRIKKPTLSQEPEVSDLAAMVLNVIPPEANSPATKIKRGMIIGAVGAIDAQAGEQLKKGATWSGTIRSLIAAGLVAQDGTKRGAGYYLTGKQAVVIDEPKKPKQPKKPKKPKQPKQPKQPKPSAELSPAVLAQAQAAALAAGVPQGEVDAIVAKAQEMHAKGQHPIAGIVTVGGNTMVTVFPLGTKTLAGIKAALLKSDPGARVFDPVVQENPYIGRGKARFFGAWG